ncbi:YceI family protein [Marinobacterium aestuariivivens]|uniref:YceI family protein n=1 Tax=Marinobacterium aestuariivivens TaxID=1698799 RepID=A0ABW2A0Y5_9GAMM
MKLTALLLTGILTPTASLAACWELRQEPGAFTFVGTQAGAPARGVFERYTGVLSLPSGDIGQGFLKVRVDVASLETQLPELNEVLRGAEFFDAARWPSAHFTSDSLKALGDDRYQVRGDLHIRDITHQRTTEFRITGPAGHRRLQGKDSIKRLDYGVGTGEWKNTRWVGNQVSVEVDVALEAVDERACGN